MSPLSILDITRDALLIVLWVSLPVVVISTLVALLVAVVQAVTQIQDQSIGQSVRIITVLVTVIVAGAWMGREVMRFAENAFQTLTVLP